MGETKGPVVVFSFSLSSYTNQGGVSMKTDSMKRITVLFLVATMIFIGTIACMVAYERMEQSAFEYSLDVAEGAQR